MRFTALASAFCMAIVATTGLTTKASAQALACGQPYTVKRGDTLQRLTNRAYGPGKSYHLMYRPNAAVVGPNPSALEIGLVLQVPCRDGAVRARSTATTAGSTANSGAASAATTVAATSTAAASSAATSTAAASAPLTTKAVLGNNRQLRIVTATDWAPYLDQGQEQGGMIVEIVKTALDTTMEEGAYKIDFVNDWAAHLNPLIADGAYDFSLVWYRPNCDVIEKLGSESQFRCRQLAWSDPVFEQVVGYYARAGEADSFTAYSDLFGKTICRPSGFSLFQLEENDLKPPAITLERAPSVQACFEQLLEGSVDIVVIATTVADDALQKLGAVSLVKDVSALSSIATLHAVTAIDNPNQDEQLRFINEGLRTLRNNGKWFEIVQRHLIAHMRRLASQ